MSTKTKRVIKLRQAQSEKNEFIRVENKPKGTEWASCYKPEAVKFLPEFNGGGSGNLSTDGVFGLGYVLGTSIVTVIYAPFVFGTGVVIAATATVGSLLNLGDSLINLGDSDGIQTPILNQPCNNETGF